MKSINFNTHRRGTAAVELAVVSPVLVLLVLGIIEVGQGMSAKQSLLDAARGGARLGTMQGTTNQQVLDEISDAMEVAGISGHSATVTPNPLSSAAKGEYVTVVVSVNFSQISWLPLPQYLQGVTLQGSCSLPHE